MDKSELFNEVCQFRQNGFVIDYESNSREILSITYNDEDIGDIVEMLGGTIGVDIWERLEELID